MARHILIPVALLAFVSAVAACASSPSILRTGQDSYTVTVPLFGGERSGREEATLEATDFCERDGKKLVPDLVQQLADNGPGHPSAYSMTFQCKP
jgi:hypothetical protein